MDKFETLLELGHVRPDAERCSRTGVPEVVFAEGKTIEQLLAAVEGILAERAQVVVSRMTNEMFTVLHGRFGSAVESSPAGRTAVVRREESTQVQSVGTVGIIAAGSSDIEAAEEARMVCQASGCGVRTAYDVGVAGIHRLTCPLREMSDDKSCRVLIVVAGMDGALPSVVAGLVDVPVIGLPTSVGYGFGGKGVGALMAMLQSCAPGLSVVNIDNGVGAAAVAVKILRQTDPERRP